MPGYWMHETSGVLGPAVEAYLLGTDLSEIQIAALRSYMRQWITDSCWDENPHARPDDLVWLEAMRARVDGLTTREAFHDCLAEALQHGIDPL